MRATRPPGHAMGEFRALYTGTGDAVAGLTGQNCGETLLGVTREVYERSAFIRQSGLLVTQDAELERRIAALLSSGEEDVTFSEASTALKKQLNRRRRNKSGQIPELEAQLTELKEHLEAGRALARQLEQLRTQAGGAAYQRGCSDPRAERLGPLGGSSAFSVPGAAAPAGRHAGEPGGGAAPAAGRRDRHSRATTSLPGCGAPLSIWKPSCKSLDKARDERDEAMKAVLRAEDAVAGNLFAGQTLSRYPGR